MFEKLQTPDNLDDHVAWEQYYQAYLSSINHSVESDNWDKIKNWQTLSYLGVALHSKERKVWFPGCGLDITPFIYSHAGCRVFGTDISAYLSNFLNELATENIEALIENHEAFAKELKDHGFEFEHLKPRFLTHDFRESFAEGKFDLIVNKKSFQLLPQESLKKASKTFFEATTVGGKAIFITLNVQGERRSIIEDHLIEAGDKGGEEQATKDKEILRAYDKEYLDRKKTEQQEDECVLHDGKTKLAYVIYNTG
ncbi:MAG: hypothetical protein B6247_07115 [Candidatus Parabeggiatoa sp. nov. 2]|nr:MAG: hypothetical protein B6247_07115 [Beggiatoa sp. 4572_84]